MTINNKDNIKIVSYLDNKDTESVYLIIKMIINSDVNQDNEMKDLKSVIIIKKKDSHSDSDDWVINSDVFYYIMWNQDFFIVYK